ncbi:MAG: hypothetical protein LBP55_01270 [Candidatus Adiutrix sp.]|jgi:hypothetical protein|nr:hypothetical protein [Candidatus Adiutrix sp.]
MTTSYSEPRRLLAPLIWPLLPETGDLDGLAAYYLSWPGWELYLARRLALSPGPGGPQPLLLPDQHSPEYDFAALDQLAQKAAELGAGYLGLDGRIPESQPALATAIAHYQPGQSTPRPGLPRLDDRAYLALWSITEHQTWQSDRLLAETAAHEKAMWAELRGGEPDDLAEPDLAAPERETISRSPGPLAARAWECWHRLAAPILAPSDIIIPVV